MTPVNTFVLVHGAWLGSWCWEEVASELRDRGHDVVAIDLPGRPNNPAPLGDVTLRTAVEHTLSVVTALPPPVVLVAHSLGGPTITHVAEAVPDHIASLVFVTAFLLESGQAAVEILRRDDATLARAARQLVDEGAASIVKRDMVKQALCHDCSDGSIARLQQRLVAETVSIARSPVRWSHQRFGRVPRAYIECTQDRIISVHEQRAMVASVGCDAVVSLDTSHSPFLAAPAELATALITAATSAQSSAHER